MKEILKKVWFFSECQISRILLEHPWRKKLVMFLNDANQYSVYENLAVCIVSLNLITIKGTVSVFSSVSPWKDGNTRFTTVSSEVLLNNVKICYQCFWFWKLLIFNYRFLTL